MRPSRESTNHPAKARAATSVSLTVVMVESLMFRAGHQRKNIVSQGEAFDNRQKGECEKDLHDYVTQKEGHRKKHDGRCEKPKGDGLDDAHCESP
jgi:hypothetical protein